MGLGFGEGERMRGGKAEESGFHWWWIVKEKRGCEWCFCWAYLLSVFDEDVGFVSFETPLTTLHSRRFALLVSTCRLKLHAQMDTMSTFLFF